MLVTLRYILTIILVLNCLVLYCQIEIKGFLIDQESTPLPFANIAIFTESDSALYKVHLTEENGSFRFEVPTDYYFIKFSYVGYEDVVKSISSSTDFHEIVFKNASTRLADVTVKASKPLLQRSHEKLIVNVENSILAGGNNSLELLQKSPGVVVDQDNNISMNGRSNVRIFIDGKDTQLNGDQLSSLLEGMPSSGIERIEIISNPSAKYEAQGNAGIIDIITKRGKLFGTNGSLSTNIGMGRHFRWDANININHKTENLNIYGQYSVAKRNQYMEIIIDRTFLDGDIPLQQVDMSTLFKLPIETHNPRIGMDYNLSEKSTIGILLTGFANITGQKSDASITLNDTNNALLESQITDANTQTNWQQLTGNIHYDYVPNNNSKLDLDVDYAKYNNDSEEVFSSSFFDRHNTLVTENSLLGSVEGNLRLYGVSADYSINFEDHHKIELGTKNTFVKTDNDLEYLDMIGETTTINAGLSNHFIYDEKINAGYFIYGYSKDKISFNLGLRAEKTAIEGNQLTTGETFNNSYTNYFPSSSLNYTFTPNHILGLSVSKRINRPSYQNLNPFRFFVNTYTYRVGNPLLTPEFTWSYELNYTLKQRYFLSMNYSRSIDNLARAIFQEVGEDVLVVSPVNIATVNSLAFNLSLPINFLPEWTSQWNISYSLNDYDGPIGGFRFDRLNQILVINSNHNISIGKGYSLQLGGFYLPEHWATVTQIEDISQISIGIQKRILNNKGSLRLNFNDIFYQGFPAGRTQFGTIDDIFISKRDTRYVNLAFSFNFGKQTVRASRPRQSAVQDELNRARQNDN